MFRGKHLDETLCGGIFRQVMAEENIECVMESRVTALIGEKKLTELEVTNLSPGSMRWHLLLIL